MRSCTECAFLILLFGVVLSTGQLTQRIDLKKFQCEDGFSCKDVICEQISCPGGRIIPKATYCGCCDKCSYEKDENPTNCNKTEIHRKKLLDEENVYAKDMWIPQCEKNGNYILKQVKRKKSVCVDVNGNRLFGQDEIYASQNMSCQCSQHINNLQKQQGITFMTKPQEHCTESGDFDRLQCNGNLCYCANTITGEIEGRLVLIDHISKLPCYNEKDSKFSYLRPCEKELIRARSLRYQFYLKGLDIIGLEKVNCDPDGSFSPLQCDSSRCSCTNEKGKQIRSYFAEEPKSTLKLITCNCARDNERAAFHFQYPMLECGYFAQCFQKDRCFCVDEDGDIISKELDSKTADESLCSELLEKLKNSEEIMSSSQPTEETTEYNYDYVNEYFS